MNRLLSDEETRQIYNRLKMGPPKWIPEIDRAIKKAQALTTLEAVKEDFGAALHSAFLSGVYPKELARFRDRLDTARAELKEEEQE